MKLRGGSVEPTELEDAFTRQSASCASLGSPMYADLFSFLAKQCHPRSPFTVLLRDASRPVHDAVPLRLAGAVHSEVLRGRGGPLAHHYPSVGGSPVSSFNDEFLAFALGNEDVVREGLRRQVQTNEVRRSIVMRKVAKWMRGEGISEFNFLEIGASAGLNLLFDTYPHSWFADLEKPAEAVSLAKTRVLQRRGCDLAPLDPTNADDMLTLRSFVWPDQHERHERLRLAGSLTGKAGVRVVRASAAEWLARELSGLSTPTVVFHSIVWQYLEETTRSNMRSLLSQVGRGTSSRAPLLWVRMEPNGKLANVRVNVWRGGPSKEYALADVGYHGESFTWRRKK